MAKGGQRLKSTLEFFSVGQLAATLFSPFRQISASETSGGSPAIALRLFFDKLISRFIGAFVRLVTIVFGLVAILFLVVYQALIICMWLLLPLFPVVGLILFAVGWMPQWM